MTSSTVWQAKKKHSTDLLLELHKLRFQCLLKLSQAATTLVESDHRIGLRRGSKVLFSLRTTMIPPAATIRSRNFSWSCFSLTTAALHCIQSGLYYRPYNCPFATFSTISALHYAKLSRSMVAVSVYYINKFIFKTWPVFRQQLRTSRQ